MKDCSKSPASKRPLASGLHRFSSKLRQRGAVLIMALLIVSMVSGLAIKFTGDYQLGLAKAESRWHGAQARSYMMGAENLAIYFLEQDEEPEVDHRLEAWAQEAPPFQIEGGWILAAVEDAQSRINVNDLSGGSKNPQLAHNDPTRFTEPQRRFIRLLQTFEDEGLPLNEDEAIGILEAVMDWTDSDNEPSGFSGAEADYYQSLDPPYVPSNDIFASVEELRLVRYVSSELMELLRPYLVMLPPGQSLNINTIPPRLMRTINSSDSLMPLSEMEVELLLQEVPEEGYYQDVQSFLSSPGWQNMTGTPDTSNLSVNTNHFMVNITVSLVEQRRSMTSLLRRSEDSFEVFRRNDIY